MKKTFRLSNLASSSVVDREMTYQYYLNKYFNLFMNSYTWTGIDKEQVNYIMRRFWSDGKVACFHLSMTTDKHPQGELVFTPYAPAMFNIYDYPTKVTLVNTRGVKFIPSRMLEVNKEVVLGWSQRNKKSVFGMVDFYLNKITDVEMTIRTNLKAQKTPWLIGVTPESENKMRALWDNMELDNPKMFLDLEEVNSAKALVSGATYNIDKLYAYKCALENELKEYLGVNNMGLTEKKEHLISTEVEANNEVVASSGDCFYDTLNEFCERIKEVFNYDISVEVNKPEIEFDYQEGENDNENE